MLDELRNARKVVGIKQSEKAVAAGDAKCAYVADDAHGKVTAPILKLCRETGVEIISVGSMADLGHACGIDVGAAVVVLLK